MTRINITLSFFTILIICTLVCGCSYHPAMCEFYIGVSGLENYTSNESVKIYVPIPVMNGEPIFTAEQMLNSTSIRWEHSQWRPTIVTTENGRMISLSTDSGKKLTNAYLSLDSSMLMDTPLENRSEVLDHVLNAPYAPVADLSETSYANLSPAGASYILWHNYTSYVYIDDKLQPIPGKNQSIYVYSKFVYDTESDPNIETSYGVLIHETLPEGARGCVPVTVYAYKRVGQAVD